MDYYQQTLKMISIIKEKKSLNVMKHFFAQLSTVEELDVFPIVNAISNNSLDYNKVITDSFKKESWHSDISLIDMRNVLVFLLWKNHKIVVGGSEAFVSIKNNQKYKDLQYRGVSSIQTDNLVHLIKNCFYIKQINIIKSTQQIDESWDSFHPFLKKYYLKNGLGELLYFCFLLIEPLI